MAMKNDADTNNINATAATNDDNDDDDDDDIRASPS